MKQASDINFIDFLSAFKRVFNNSINTSTDWFSNKIIYEFNLTNFFNIVFEEDIKKFKAEHKIHQQKAQNSIAWANLVIKK